MGAEAFRGTDERHADRRSGLIGLAGAGVSSALLWNRNAVGFGVIVADNFGLFVTLDAGRRRRADDHVLVAGASSATACPPGEYYALVLFSIVGMMMMATATDLLVIFIALEILSLAVYVLTGIRRDNADGHRGGVQVLPARRVLERVLPLRHRVHLRRHRQHAAGGGRRRTWRRSR